MGLGIQVRLMVMVHAQAQKGRAHKAGSRRRWPSGFPRDDLRVQWAQLRKRRTSRRAVRSTRPKA
jgi:hypothetical protein